MLVLNNTKVTNSVYLYLNFILHRTEGCTRKRAWREGDRAVMDKRERGQEPTHRKTNIMGLNTWSVKRSLYMERTNTYTDGVD